MKIIPLGGLGEIGMNCMIFETEDEIILVDCGLLFSELDHFGVDLIVPNFSYLVERKEKIKAVFATHGHEDHIGALPFLDKAGIEAPIYCTPFTGQLIRQRFKEHTQKGLTVEVKPPGSVVQTKDFRVESVLVNHSIVDATGLVIDTPVGRVIHTGDFRLDPVPHYGSCLDLRKFREMGDKGVLLLLSDSTNVERDGVSLSEAVVDQNLERLMEGVSGLTLITLFASNVARVDQIFQVAKKMDKKIALAGRSMDAVVRNAHEVGYIKAFEHDLIPIEDLEAYPREKVIVLSSGCQGEYRSAMARIAAGEHRQVQLQTGDRVLFSSSQIPGNEKAIGRMINLLYQQGAEVFHERLNQIHASGHATRPELKAMLEAVRPKYFVPIHGEYRMLVKHAELAEEAGVKRDNIFLAENGDILQLEPDSLESIGLIEDTRVMLEDHAGNYLTKELLKERRKLAETGVVFAMLVWNREKQKVIAGPGIITSGVLRETVVSTVVSEAEQFAKSTIEHYQRSGPGDFHGVTLKEALRVELRRFFVRKTGSKPVVVPLFVEV